MAFEAVAFVDVAFVDVVFDVVVVEAVVVADVAVGLLFVAMIESSSRLDSESALPVPGPHGQVVIGPEDHGLGVEVLVHGFHA